MKYEIYHRYTKELIFVGDNLVKAEMKKANLTGKNFNEEIIIQANLEGADLSNANFCRANLKGANITWANLTNTNFKVADLRQTDLSGSNLTNANLKFTNLKGANLEGAKLKGADLTYADLRGANLNNTDIYSFSLGKHFGWAHFGDQYLEGSHIRINNKAGNLTYWKEKYKTIFETCDYSEKDVSRYKLVLDMLETIQQRGLYEQS